MDKLLFVAAMCILPAFIASIIHNLKKFKIKNFIMLTIAGIINAFGVTVFLMPVKLYDSGISGTSMLLDQLTPEYLTLSILVTNVT